MTMAISTGVEKEKPARFYKIDKVIPVLSFILRCRFML